MISIMGKIEPENPQLFALEFGKIAESDFVYTLASTNINQSAPNLVKMYVTIRSRMRLIMDLIRAELSELFAFEFAKIARNKQLLLFSRCVLLFRELSAIFIIFEIVCKHFNFGRV